MKYEVFRLVGIFHRVNKSTILNIYRKKIIWKLVLLIMAIVIGVSSLLYTQNLINKLKAEERKKVEQWAEATRLIESTEDASLLTFLFSIIEENNTVPVILTDEIYSINGFRNFDPVKSEDPDYLVDQLKKMRENQNPLVITFGDGMKNYIFYNESTILTKLRFYPYIQLSVIIFFIAISYLAFSMSRKAEQNQVWVGMSKETAHQLGTPTSSLAGWAELIKMNYPESNIPDELARDVARLEKITDRFSKIGSKPELSDIDLFTIISGSIDYLKLRSGSKVEYIINNHADENLKVPLNLSLFEWVLENLFKNAVDAMSGQGTITITISDNPTGVIIDVSDSGKGIPKSAHKNIFKPGYTTKSKGWGLGLSLSKRIIEIYHNGKIFVRHSETGKGSCIRIILKKTNK